jgi:AAA domain
MNTLPHVCLIGDAGAGKTTVAELLVKQFGYARVSFAESLKVMLDTQTDRTRLQEFGTDVVRAYEPDAWVRLFLYLNKVRFDTSPPALVVDDTRFRNEVDELVQDGWRTCRVSAPLDLRIARLKANGKYVEGMFAHSSEQELRDYQAEFRIVNDGWVDYDLLPDVEQLVNELAKP